MFYFVSKFLGFFLIPLHILVGLGGLGIVLTATPWQRYRARHQPLRRRG